MKVMGEKLFANSGPIGIGLGVVISVFESLISASESCLFNGNPGVGQKGEGVTITLHLSSVTPEPLFSELLSQAAGPFVPLPASGV